MDSNGQGLFAAMRSSSEDYLGVEKAASANWSMTLPKRVWQQVIRVSFQVIFAVLNPTVIKPTRPAQSAPSMAMRAMPEAKYSPADRQLAMRQ